MKTRNVIQTDPRIAGFAIALYIAASLAACAVLAYAPDVVQWWVS